MFAETVQNLIALLETESNTDIEWFQNNKNDVQPWKVPRDYYWEKEEMPY